MKAVPKVAILIFVTITGCIPDRYSCTEITQTDYLVHCVIHGDTFKVTYVGELTSVRLAGVDAPERNEPGGPEATAPLRELVDGRTVRLQFTDPDGRKRDNFGRLLASVEVGGRDVGAVLVGRGVVTVRR